MAVELKFSRVDRVYRPPDVVEGTVLIITPTGITHQGVRLIATGTIMLQLSARQVGVFEALYSSVKPIQLMNKTIDISPAGKISPGKTEFPFHIALEPSKGGLVDSLYESYHGAYVNIQYSVGVEISRGYLMRPISSTAEFIVEGQRVRVPRAHVAPEAVNFYITQDTQKHILAPVLRSGGFRITGRVATRCALSEPITGELTVDSSTVPIRSIDLQLLRVESVNAGEKMATETSEIQSTQVADGDICRGLTMPIYMVLPRLFTCPTLSAGAFSLEFELSIVVTFDVGLSKHAVHTEANASKQVMAYETLPLRLVRT